MQLQKKEECPLDGNCQQEDVVYQATIYNPVKKETRKYIGSTTNFKTRFAGHKSSFKNEKTKNATTMSSYIWDNHLGPQNIKWEILYRAPSYMAGQKNCSLCLTEKLAIARTTEDQMYLNKRNELAQKCKHKHKFKLGNFNP